MQKAKTRQTNIILSHEKLNAQITVFHLLYAAVTYYKNTFVMKLCFYYYFLLIQLYISSTSNVNCISTCIGCYGMFQFSLTKHPIPPHIAIQMPKVPFNVNTTGKPIVFSESFGINIISLYIYFLKITTILVADFFPFLCLLSPKDVMVWVLFWISKDISISHLDWEENL